MWVTHYAQAKISKITAAGVVTSFSLSGGPVGITIFGSYAWVTLFNSNSVVRVKLADGTVAGSAITVGNGPIDLVSDGNNIWVTNFESNSVTEICATGN